MEAIRIHSRSCLWVVLLSAAPALAAAPSSDLLLPSSTKGYLSVAQPAEFEERWRQTQFGQMLDDELMQPFVESVREQLRDEYRAFEDKLGLEWDDLEGVPAGELSLSIVEREGDEAALAITMDVTGREREAEGLLAAVERRFAARGGRRQSEEVRGTTLHVFTAPTQPGSPPQTTIYFIREDVLCGIDDRREADAMLRRFGGEAKDNLRSLPAYAETMERCRREANGLEPEARWFAEPFGFVFAARTLQESRARRNEQDVAKILFETGFDAIHGVGGFFNQLVEGEIEYLHRAAVYAPPVNPNDPLRWTKSMRMLQLPNVAAFEPQSWAPRMLATYTTLNLRLSDAFDNVGPLVDALEEHEGAWENSLRGWEHDVYGPRMNVRKEFIENLGQRITLLAAYDTPIRTDSERSLVAIEATNEQALAEALAKWMQNEPDVVRREVGQFIIWERVAPEHAVNEPDVPVPGFFTPLQPERQEKEAKEEEEERERVLPNAVMTVALGHLMMASDMDYLGEILEGFAQRERLATSADYQQVSELLRELAASEHSAFTFGRSDEEFRPTFELIRQGRMPEAKTMLGKLLNNLLTTEKQREDGELRRQRIDGSTLPSFEAVRRYFGPHGCVVRSENDGWFVTDAMLNKEAP